MVELAKDHSTKVVANERVASAAKARMAKNADYAARRAGFGANVARAYRKHAEATNQFWRETSTLGLSRLVSYGNQYLATIPEDAPADEPVEPTEPPAEGTETDAAPAE